jgi:hypothetical protein
MGDSNFGTPGGDTDTLRNPLLGSQVTIEETTRATIHTKGNDAPLTPETAVVQSYGARCMASHLDNWLITLSGCSCGSDYILGNDFLVHSETSDFTAELSAASAKGDH